MELDKIRKIECVTDKEKVNLMLNNGWKIIEILKKDCGDPYGTIEILHFVLGHEEADAEIPLTDNEKRTKNYDAAFGFNDEN